MEELHLKAKEISSAHLCVLVVDDHVIARGGCVLVLNQLTNELKPVEASSLAEALQVCHENPEINLVLLDLNLPDSAGIQTLEIFRQTYPQVPVAVLSGQYDRETFEGTLRLGARGFICKGGPVSLFVSALQVILSGGIYLPPEFSLPDHSQLQAEPSRKSSNVEQSLSARQKDVLQLLVKGYSNKLIARELGISVGTIKNYVSGLLRLFGVHSRSHLMLMMISKHG